jgi:integrase
VRPFQRVDRPRLRVLTAEEARRLLNALPPALRALARGALYTGARLGELQAFTVADVDDGEVRVRHSKSGRARSVPLTRDGVALLEQVMAGKAADARVFEPVSRVALARAMKAACVAAKITPAAHFHDLRRSYGSLLLNSGAPIDSIQRLLGHSDARMTMRTYAHLQQETLRQHVTQHLPSFGRERTNVTALKPRRRSKKAAP